MRIFQTPQEPFLTPEFYSLLSSYLPLTYVHGIPTINGKTFFWSTQKFEGIKKQYLIGENLRNAKKSFFVQDPKPYVQTLKAYAPGFRNKIRKAQKNKLIFRMENQPSLNQITECYRIYDANMVKIMTFSFSPEFFSSLFTLPFVNLLTVSRPNELLAFGLMLGNLLFIQSSSPLGKSLGANNLLYDELFKLLQNQTIFSGIAGKSNVGLYAFKMHAGLRPIPAQPSYFDPVYFIPKFLRHNALAGWAVRLIDKQKILPYVLPY